MAERTGFEPATPGVTGRYSNQLNYRSADLASWWVLQGSNLRPTACKAVALPTELNTRWLGRAGSLAVGVLVSMRLRELTFACGSDSEMLLSPRSSLRSDSDMFLSAHEPWAAILSTQSRAGFAPGMTPRPRRWRRLSDPRSAARRRPATPAPHRCRRRRGGSLR